MMNKNRKAWLTVIACVAILMSGLAFVPWFTLANASRFDWVFYASVYEPRIAVYFPLIIH